MTVSTALRGAVSVRPATEADRPFLFAAYASTRDEELARVPWSDEQKHAFLAMQFHAQDQDYRTRHPDGRFLVVELAGEAIGRLYLADLEDGLRILDIALLPEHRQAGIGSVLLAAVLREADAAGRKVSLHVEHWNLARRLYARLGFVEVAANEVYLRLERAPRPVS